MNPRSWRTDAVWFVVGVGVGLLAAACVVFLATVTAWLEGAYTARELLTSTSPDGKYQVVVSSRVTFPTFDLLDPELLVHITLTDSHSSKKLDGVELTLMEKSDVGDPRAEWAGNGVRITDLERWHNITATVRADTWTTGKQ